MFEVTVEKLVYGGDGLARLDGRVVFTPFVLPGERILVQPEQEKPGLVRARIVELLEPAPERTAPPCPVFGRCGGCHYQHAPYEQQLAAKRAILAEELRRLGKVEPPEEIGVIASVTQAFCRDCTRARLSTDGKLYTCLFADSGYDLRSLLRENYADEQIANAIGAIWRKRADRYSEIRSANTPRDRRIEMSYIGG